MTHRRPVASGTQTIVLRTIFALAGLATLSPTWTLPTGLAVTHADVDAVYNISRHNEGDTFISSGAECGPDTCVGLSSGTAGPKDGQSCTCQCLGHLPAFRNDLNICVDDIHECPLAPFVSGATSQHIPFVFLPLKGQIIHPSKDISFAGVKTPICAVSGAQFLTRGGWVDLRNPLDADVPFRLFRDEGRTFLQWLGESELRIRMSGRLILVHMLCRDVALEAHTPEMQPIFSPCVAFRVVGTPTKHQNNVSEVLFSPDAQSAIHASGGLNSSEYVAIGICSILLGLIYVASVFLYLHLRKRRQKETEKKEAPDADLPNRQLTNEEIIVKSNPLLGMSPRHFSTTDATYSDSASGTSDTDRLPDVLKHHEDTNGNRCKNQNNQMQITAALIHPSQQERNFSLASISCHSEPVQLSDSSNIERLPEENVSIIETIEGREERPETVRAIVNNSTRRKLYFNPAYFEPHLLQAPPPAAIEFLTKIREVITIAKHKMATKRFSPSLMGIPEEDSNRSTLDPIYDFYHGVGSRRSSAVSLKRENSRRRAVTTNNVCPGCEPSDIDILRGRLPELTSVLKCQSCVATANETKKRSIRKWLEDVPVLKSPVTSVRSEDPRMLSSYISEKLKSNFENLPERSPSRYSDRCLDKTNGPLYRQSSLNMHQSTAERKTKPKLPERMYPAHRKSQTAIKVPPPVTPNSAKIVSQSLKKNSKKETITKKSPPLTNGVPSNLKLPPPDMINEAMVVDNKKPRKTDYMQAEPVAKQKMAAVINEFAVLVKPHVMENGHKISSSSSSDLSAHTEFETDSLERSHKPKGFHTPTDYGDVSSSQPSPSLSTALPLDEEMTMRNAIFNVKTGDQSNAIIPHPDEHEYEVIALNNGVTSNPKGTSMYKLPELLTRNDGYSLVSEVYVNNGYNFDSAPTSSSDSDCSSIRSHRPKIHYTEPERPGHLLIEVEDCADNYIRVEDSDNFEPDTLDRKPSKLKIERDKPKTIKEYGGGIDYIDSLERPGQILLRTTGSFKSNVSDGSSRFGGKMTNPFNRNFGSLREIYEAKTKYNLRAAVDKANFSDSSNSLNRTLSWKRSFTAKDFEEGRILTLEERHSRRQRKSTPPNTTMKTAPPDVIPPLPPKSSPIYQHPKPPRKVIQEDKPPLPPKNAAGRSTKRLGTKSSNKEDEESASPNSTMSFSLPSSISGTSGQTASSDYETYFVTRDSGEDDNLKLCKHQGATIVENFTQRAESVRRSVGGAGGAHTQFILKTAVPNHHPKHTAGNIPQQPFLAGHLDASSGSHCSANRELVKHFCDSKETEAVKKSWRKVVALTSPRPEDSGYLSTDSNESKKDPEGFPAGLGSVSETDESLGDAHSESGAESVETHSVFFGSFRKRSYLSGSVDSGVGSDWLKSPIMTSFGTTSPVVTDEIDDPFERLSLVTVLPVKAGMQS